MFRTLVKTDALAVEDRTVPVRYFELRTLRGRAALQRGDSARAGRPHHPGRRLGDEPRSADDVPGAGDALQPDAGAHDRGSLRRI